MVTINIIDANETSKLLQIFLFIYYYFYFLKRILFLWNNFLRVLLYSSISINEALESSKLRVCHLEYKYPEMIRSGILNLSLKKLLSDFMYNLANLYNLIYCHSCWHKRTQRNKIRHSLLERRVLKINRFRLMMIQVGCNQLSQIICSLRLF